MSKEEKSSYKQIMKATSLFGGVQVINIFIKIIRSKFIAVLLGPEGMGIAGLLNTTTSLISGLTNFGLGTSAVKNVSAANGTGDKQRVGEVVAVLRRLVWFTGLLGMVLTIIFSPWLSELTFGNRDYTLAFVWISVTLLLNQISSGQSVVLQGMRKLKYLAQSSVSGALIGLCISIPIYFVWGIDGIVPAIIISSMAALLRTWFFARRVAIEKVEATLEVTKKVGKDMMTMGFMLSLSGLISLGASYLVRIFISNTGGIEQVGLYTAGIVLIESYVGMVFKAMGTDYYPRLASVNSDNIKIRELVNQQASVAVLILAPVIVVFLIFMPYVVQFLYSTKFLPVTGMISWAILGVYFRAASWSMGFILYAKGDSNLFLKTALGFNLIFLLNNFIGFYYGGLTGIGISFLINYAIHFLSLMVITKHYYNFNFIKLFFKIFIAGLLLCLLAFGVSFVENTVIKLSLGIVLISIVSLFSFNELNKRMELKDYIKKFKNKFNRK